MKPEKKGLFADSLSVPGAAGDKVLASAEHIVDSFSIEPKGLSGSGGGRNVRRSVLTGVAMVPFPGVFERTSSGDCSGFPSQRRRRKKTIVPPPLPCGPGDPTGGAKTESCAKAALSDAIQILADVAVGRRTCDSVSYAELVDITQTGITLDGNST